MWTGPWWHFEWISSSLLWQGLWVCWLSVSDSVWRPQWVQTQDWIPGVSTAFIYIFNHIHSAVQFFQLNSLLFEVSDFYLNFFLLSLKEFLPKEYIKHKGDKKIFQVRSGLLCHTAQRCLVATLGWNFSRESEMQQIQHATLNELIPLNDFFSFVSAGTQKLSEHDRDWGQSQLCEACQVSENLRSVILFGQGERKGIT